MLWVYSRESTHLSIYPYYYDIFVYKYIVDRDLYLGKLRFGDRVQTLFSIVFFNTYVKNASTFREMLSPGGSSA